MAILDFAVGRENLKKLKQIGDFYAGSYTRVFDSYYSRITTSCLARTANSHEPELPPGFWDWSELPDAPGYGDTMQVRIAIFNEATGHNIVSVTMLAGRWNYLITDADGNALCGIRGVATDENTNQHSARSRVIRVADADEASGYRDVTYPIASLFPSAYSEISIQCCVNADSTMTTIFSFIGDSDWRNGAQPIPFYSVTTTIPSGYGPPARFGMQGKTTSSTNSSEYNNIDRFYPLSMVFAVNEDINSLIAINRLSVTRDTANEVSNLGNIEIYGQFIRDRFIGEVDKRVVYSLQHDLAPSVLPTFYSIRSASIDLTYVFGKTARDLAGVDITAEPFLRYDGVNYTLAPASGKNIASINMDIQTNPYTGLPYETIGDIKFGLLFSEYV